MKFSKLKLTGFKSFVEPATLRIKPGLTGVVGPNGCGKSNLLEAIRWVMGENSPKSMRSGGMDDVIFAGTQSRPPRDFAEVVLEAETHENEELHVVRRIERGAGSAYRVNGRDVRAKDVALTFADAATGAHSPALVSQGKIAAVIAAKPTERRQMLEEAAGIAGLHVRRRDAESKLRQTETNLARLEDLMAGLDSQIGSLKRQARQAERYKALSGQIQCVEARLVFARWRDAAAAADAARMESEGAEGRVAAAKAQSDRAQKDQADATVALSEAREELADRRDDASAHGHRMAALTSQLETAEQRLADLDRQKSRLEQDQGDVGRLTTDAADALGRLEKDLVEAGKALTADEEHRPALVNAVENAERASRAAELALARATADHAGISAEWRVADAALEQTQARLDRLIGEAQRQADLREDLLGERDADAVLAEARGAAQAATNRLAELRKQLEDERARKDEMQTVRDQAAAALSAARAELAGVEREFTGLERDRDARVKRQKDRSGQALAIDRLRAEPGYERALAAVLGRDAKSPLGTPEQAGDGRFWTGRNAPKPVTDSLAKHVPHSPSELAARLALVHVADSDDGRTLAPGEWLVTMTGALRRWDGFVARGEGSAEAAWLEAQNRHAELAGRRPKLRETAEAAEREANKAVTALSDLQRDLVARERDVAAASEDERSALRALDQAEAAKERMATRMEQLGAAAADLAEQRTGAERELAEAQANKADLPDPEAAQVSLDTAQAKNETARSAHQSALGALAAHDQALAVGRERTGARRADISGWQARAGDAARRLSDMGRRADEIEEEHTVVSAKPAGLIREIEGGEKTRARLGEDLQKAQQALETAEATMREANMVFAEANENLASARETRAASSARAENEEERRREMARIAGERFQTPPPLLPTKFDFSEDHVRSAGDESAVLEKLTADRERIGPVNLVAADELAKIEHDHGASAEEQAELHEAVNRLRGSIGNLNREGRERLRSAFMEVNDHFKRLFSSLFEGGQAYLELIDSDDPLEAGLEIFAQPPGKRLQSLTLLSGGEQALTAVALIFGLFLTNPAPICVLDEVDAPLDDANIDRFCDLLDRMTRETDTRYLIVTHNAVTMSRMHRLFGVTMIEQGISRLVSVDLGGAEEILAAE